jgi:L-ornithine Nalpha-acyltransferase
MALAAALGTTQKSVSALSQILPQKSHANAIGAAILGRIGCLSVRLAETAREIEAALVLRYQVFFAERDQTSNPVAGRDADHFDDLCDHLLVFDDSLAGPPESQIVGTYRLLREEHSLLAGGFYSEAEYDVHGLVNRHKSRRFLELGRSCVLPEYRSKRTVELLWQGIWAYCRSHAIDVMFGCASFPGTISAKHALPLSFLHHHARATGEWRVKALEGRGSPMDLMPEEAVDVKSALFAMPPLIKGYLRLGAKFGEHAVVDNEFGSTDVFVIVRTEEISERYLNHYGPEATRFA